MARIRCEKCGIKYGSSLGKCPHCTGHIRHRVFRNRLLWFLVPVLFVVVAVLAVTLLGRKTVSLSAHSRIEPLPSLNQLLAMSTDELAKQDIAIVNLACAEGLYGAENIDKEACLRQVDEWAGTATKLMKEREFRFYAAPEKTNHSINRWRCAALVQFLNQIIGLSYNPSLKNRPTGQPYDTSYFRDSRDFLIHGLIIQTNRGTCASMPVLFTAVARRMGYPIKLVTTRNHLFARWDSPAETFNIEMTDKFAEFKSNEFYRTFPAKLNPGEVERQGYLQSLSPERELSSFLHLRAMCLWDHGKLVEARDILVASARLDPAHKQQGLQNHFILEITAVRLIFGRSCDQPRRIDMKVMS